MNDKIKEATELAINLHKDMDTRGIPKRLIIKHNAIGQCLGAILEIIENDNERNKNAPA